MKKFIVSFERKDAKGNISRNYFQQIIEIPFFGSSPQTTYKREDAKILVVGQFEKLEN